MLHYKISGSGSVCVFLHGFLESMTMWDYLSLSELKGKHVLIDLPGHGKSSIIEDQIPSIDSMVESVMSVLSKEGIEEFDVIGHSMGGYVALCLKDRMPRCRRVVLLNSNYWSDSPKKQKDRERVAEIAFASKNYFLKEAIPNLFSKPQKHTREIEQLISEAKNMSSEAISYASIAMKNRRNMRNILNKSDYLVIHGRLDKHIQKEHFNLEALGESNFHEIAGAGHMCHIEKPGQVIDILGSYLSS